MTNFADNIYISIYILYFFAKSNEMLYLSIFIIPKPQLL